MFHHPGAYHSQWGRFNLGAKLAEKKVFIALFLSVGRPSFVNSILNRIEKKEGGKKAASALPQEEFMPAGITLIFFLILSFFVHSALCIALIPVGISRSIVEVWVRVQPSLQAVEQGHEVAPFRQVTLCVTLCQNMRVEVLSPPITIAEGFSPAKPDFHHLIWHFHFKVS